MKSQTKIKDLTHDASLSLSCLTVNNNITVKGLKFKF